MNEVLKLAKENLVAFKKHYKNAELLLEKQRDEIREITKTIQQLKIERSKFKEIFEKAYPQSCSENAASYSWDPAINYNKANLRTIVREIQETKQTMADIQRDIEDAKAIIKIYEEDENCLQKRLEELGIPPEACV